MHKNQELNGDKMVVYYCRCEKQHCGKMTEYWFPAFAYFPTGFSRDFFWLNKTHDSVEKIVGTPHSIFPKPLAAFKLDHH